ncbi:T9SS type A sorting domain-containing protein [bacterium]|nr:T9SS type A sorting domain-containing protein [bacterium]
MGAGLHFDGFDKFVSIPSYPNLQLENDDFAWVLFIRTDGLGGTPGEDFMIMGNREDNVYHGGNFMRLHIQRDTGILYVRWGGDTPYIYLYGNTNLLDSEWHQVALTRSGNTLSIYVDGVLDAEQTFTSIPVIPSIYGHRLGAAINPGGDAFRYPFVGNMDEVSMWSRALSASEINDYFTNAPSAGDTGIEGYWAFDEDTGQDVLDQVNGNNGILGLTNNVDPYDPLRSEGYSYGGSSVGSLVAYWNCDEGSGSILHNATGSHLDGTLFDGATWSNSGHENGSLDIPGYTAGVIVPDHPDLDITDQIVLDFWFYPRTYAGEWPRIMIGKQHAVSDWCYAVYWGEDNYSDGIVFSIGNGSGGASIHYQESIDLNVWHHLVASYDGTVMQLNIDEQLVGTTATSEAIGTSDYDLRIGSHFSPPNRSFDGLLDEIKIYDAIDAYPVYEVDDYTEALWRFNEAVGTYTAYDATTNNHTMALTAGAEFTGTSAFNGSVDCTGPSAVATNFDEIGNSWDALSIDVHFMATVIGDDNTHPLVTRYRWHNAGDPSYLFWVMPDGSLFGKVYMNEPGGVSVWGETAAGVIQTDQWYDVQMTWSSDNTLKIFVDGELLGESTMTNTGFVRPGDDPLEVGAVYYTGYPPEFFTGYIDEVRISDIDRSGQQPPDGPITLTLTPNGDTTIPPGGGTLTYTVHLVSTLPDQFNNVYYWTNLILPDGSEYPQGGWLMSQHVILRPFMDVTQTGFTQNIPVFADPGEYEFQSHFGYLSGMYVSDSFMFTKLDGISAGNEVIDWNASGNLGLDDPDLNDPLPVEWEVAAATPNPFNPSTTIRVALPEAAELTVTVTNILGQRVALLTDGLQEAGEHALVFDAQGLASGLYFIHAHVPGELNQVQKVMLVR